MKRLLLLLITILSFLQSYSQVSNRTPQLIYWGTAAYGKGNDSLPNKQVILDLGKYGGKQAALLLTPFYKDSVKMPIKGMIGYDIEWDAPVYYDNTWKKFGADSFLFATREWVLSQPIDKDSTNELQFVSLVGDTLVLSKGNRINLPYLRVDDQVIYHFGNGIKSDSTGVYVDTVFIKDIISNNTAKIDSSIYWIKGGIISSVPAIGDTVLPGTPDYVWRQMYKKSVAPTCALTLSFPGLGISNQTSPSAEKRPAGTVFTGTANWTANRQLATDNLLNITAAGVTQSAWSNPSAPGSVSGTQAISVTANSNQSYTLVVTTSDGKQCSLTRSDSWYNKRYWGFIPAASTTPTNTQILAMSSDISGTSRIFGSTTVVNNGGGAQQRLCILIPMTAYSAAMKVLINNADATSLFPMQTVSVTNQYGYTEDYAALVQAGTTAGNITFTTQ